MFKVQVSGRRVSAVYVQTIYCSEYLLIGCSTGRMQPLLPHGTLCITVAMCAWLTPTQHCIFSWLKQESSQEKCPMCRQRTSVPDYQVLQLTSYLSFQIEESRRAGRHRDTRPDTGANDQPAISPRVSARTATLLEQYLSEQCAKDRLWRLRGSDASASGPEFGPH
jgi:hypothetical protein